MCVSLTSLARSITVSAERLGCAPYGRHTLIRFAHPSGQPAAVTALRYVSLLAQERCAKEGHPDIRVSLRETSLVPAPLRGPAYMGHPWPIKPLAASMRLVPLHDTSTRPPDGTGARACKISTGSSSAASVFAFALELRSNRRRQSPSVRRMGDASPVHRPVIARWMKRASSTLRTGELPAIQGGAQSPSRRANAIVVEEVERHGCRESRDGPWMALRGVPLERRWSERTPAQPGPDDRAEGFGYFCPQK